ncbi:tetratricopeptide repeat protein [Thermoproteota archaeon]
MFSRTAAELKKGLVILVLMICAVFPNIVCAEDNLLTHAETYYQAGQYQRAVETYEQGLSQYPGNVTLLYNLGNSYYRMGEIGRAVYYFKKAQRLSPRDADIRVNLASAKEKVVDKVSKTSGIGPPLNWDWLVSWVSFNEAVAGLLVILILFNSLLLLYVIKKRGELFRNVFFSVFGVLIIYLIFFGMYYQTMFHVKHGIIISTKIEAKSEPSSTVKTLFYLHEGVECRVLKQIGQWDNIELKNGLSGWVKSNDLMVL